MSLPFNEKLCHAQHSQLLLVDIPVIYSEQYPEGLGNTVYVVARLRQNGVIVSNVESVLFEWLRDATHPEFKTLSKLIK